MSNFKDLINKKKVELSSTSGSIVNGIVLDKIQIKENHFYRIDLGLKYEGLLPLKEFANLEPNTKLPFFILEENNEYFNLSYEKAQKKMSVEKVKNFYENKEKVLIKIIAKSKDGFRVTLLDNISALFETDKEFEVDSTHEVFISKIFKNGNIIVSENQDFKVSKFKEGMIISATVISFNDHFVFVEIKNSDMEGIVHFQDLSWEKINFPGEVVAQGEELKLKILKVQNKILYLGLKQLMENPWHKIKSKFTDLNQTYEGKVKSINDYELLVDLGEGVTGSVHISESSWGFKKGSSLNQDFKIGEAVKFKIIEIDSHRKKIKLSIKQIIENPFFSFVKKYKEGDEVEGSILHDHTAYGSFLFVELVNGVDGILHQSEMDWNYEKGISKFIGLEKDQKIKVKIFNIDMEKSRISVSVKRRTKDFFESKAETAMLGNIYDLEVKEIKNDEGLICESPELNNCYCLIRRNEVSNDKNVRLYNFNVGDKIKAKLVAKDKFKRIFFLSIKALQVDENKDAIKKNKNVSSTSSFGNFLE